MLNKLHKAYEDNTSTAQGRQSKPPDSFMTSQTVCQNPWSIKQI